MAAKNGAYEAMKALQKWIGKGTSHDRWIGIVSRSQTFCALYTSTFKAFCSVSLSMENLEGV